MSEMQQTTPAPLAIGQLPDYIAKLASKDKKFAEDLGRVEASDLSLNMLKIVHGQSPQARAGWGPNRDKPALPVGTMFLSRDGSIIPAGTPFVILMRDCTYIKWEGRPGDGRMVFLTKDPQDPRIVEIDGLAFKKNPQTGETVSPEVTQYVNFYIMLAGHADMPTLLSFKRTGIPDARRLTQDLLVAMQAGELPMYSFMHKLRAPKEKQDGNLFWHLIAWEPSGFIPENYLPKAERLANMSREMINFQGDRIIQEIEKLDDQNMQPARVEARPAQVTEIRTTAPVAPTQNPALPLPPPILNVVIPPAPSVAVHTAPAATPALVTPAPTAAAAPTGNVSLF
jgi:hypothetical protein